MKRELSPAYVALFLVLGCILLRFFNSLFPEIVPNISPLMAIAYVGAMHLPRRWGWLVGPVAMLLTDLAFTRVNYLTNGAMFSWWTVVSLGIYAAAGGFGILIARRKSLVKIIGGSLVCSLVFYVAANTFAWRENVLVGMTPAYPATLAGWWQANTIGLSGFEPTWMFLRNGMAGDLFFVLLLLLVLDRGFLLGQASTKTAARTA